MASAGFADGDSGDGRLELSVAGYLSAPALGPREPKAAGQRGSSRSVVGRTSERTIACA
jgi:hypothetical protein